MFKSIFGFLLCLCTIMFASLSFAELTPQDLKEIRLIVKEEIDKELTPIKADIVSLKEGFARLDARLTGVEKQIAMVANLVFALIALIVVAVGIPQIIMTWRSRKESASEMQIAALIQEQSKMLSSLTAEVETLREKVYYYFNEPQ
ncbi:hypothetical protein F4141_21155 [Candidatus Poribacteria bacterium]|nr:hypothetical protein [Candidatus Poribacteria bacterium]MYH83198.1 hypothetical protein [Candidatus Poribacteria bacterium]